LPIIFGVEGEEWGALFSFLGCSVLDGVGSRCWLN
jgi:hypothetical protein